MTKRLIRVQCVLLAGLGSVFLLPHATKNSPAGIAMVLPRVVGDWIGDDASVSQKERDILAKDTQFARKTYFNLTGDQIFVSIVLSGEDMTNSIHRPERCLPAQGWTVESADKRHVMIPDGKTLELTRLRNSQLIETADRRKFTLHNLNYYWFIGSDKMTASHLTRTSIDLRDRVLHGYNQRWAYITVAAIVPEGGQYRAKTEEETAAMIEKFITELAPKLRRPDGNALL